MRRARIEVVLPAPAGADSGCTSHGERPMFSHGALLIRRQVRGVVVFDPQHGAVVARVDQIEHRGLLAQDGVEGEALMAFALMCGPGRGEPHRNLVDGGFEQLAGGALGVAPAVARRGSRRGRRG